MAIRRNRKRAQHAGPSRGRQSIMRKRELLLETLEDRRLLAGIPQLAGIQSNDGQLLDDGDVLNIAPRELVFSFNQAAEIDNATLGAIQILGSGQDGQFGRATASTDLNTASAVLVQFTAVSSGVDGNGIQVSFTRSDHGNASGPFVVVDSTERTIALDLNTNASNSTTAQGVLDAINNSDEAASLVSATLTTGNPLTDIAAQQITYSPVVLAGSNDVVIEPGFVGLVDSAREVVFRFRETLVDDTYQVVIDGSSPVGLKDLDGSQFQEGEDFSLVFQLELGALVSAVVPQPLVRDVGAAGAISQQLDTIHVYFNEDDLDVDSATNPDFYQLVYTASSVDSTDDVIFKPSAVSYDAELDRAVLTFATDINQLTDSNGDVIRSGIFRLRVGTDEAARPTPLAVDLQAVVADAGSEFAAAQTVGRNLLVAVSGDQLSDGQSFDITDDSGVIKTFEFDTGDGTALHPGANLIGVTADASFTSEDVATAIGSAINSAGFQVRATLDESRITLVHARQVEHADIVVTGDGSTLNDGQTIIAIDEIGQSHVVEIDTGFLLQVPAPGSDPTIAVTDGQTFEISDGTTSVTFEFNLSGTTAVASGNEEVSYSGSESAADLANIVVAAINQQSLGLTATPLTNGAIHIGGTTDHTLTTDPNFTAVTQSGAPGVASGSVAVPVIPSAAITSLQLATAITDAVNGANLIGISAQQDGVRVFVDGIQSISSPSSLSGILFAADVSIEQFQSLLLSAEIEPQDHPLPEVGGVNEIGHRDVRVEQHINGQLDQLAGTSTQFYSFPNQYGTDPQGNILLNAITEEQKTRAREIFEIYASELGIEFVETDNLGFGIVTGDMRAIDPTLPIGVGGVLGVAGNNMAIMDLQDFQSAGDGRYGGPWFRTAMHEIGHLLGLGHSYDLPAITVQGDDPALTTGPAPEGVYPGDHDLVHGRLLYKPDSVDIDLYRIPVDERGILRVETVAERHNNPSLLDTYVALYQETTDSNGDLHRQLISSNDDYFSNDSYIELTLDPGTYYIGVSASGNDDYNPEIADSGYGGLSQGKYDLRLTYRPDADNSLIDSSSVALDGDGDGVAGGVFNFWFQTAIPAGLDVAGEPRTLFVDKIASQNSIKNGELDSPFSTINAALAAASPGDIVRLIGNAGADGDLSTLEDNVAYQLGFSRFGGTVLEDGDSLLVPQDVTVMVDAGVIFKSRRARVGVGSSSPTIDRSGGAFQVLGTPRVVDAAGNLVSDAAGDPIAGSVYFTSLHDTTIGSDSNPDLVPPAPLAGDWGGIEFRNDIDKDRPNRFLHANAGVFLSYVNHAEIAYGGGSVFVEGVSQVVSPLHLVDARPTLTFNSIHNSAESAISANPDSFEETNFLEPRFQGIPFTSDYGRVGPDIHHNTVVDNSINGLFVRIDTPAGNQLEVLSTTARMDDVDITHVITENLVIQGSPGGPVVENETPPTALVTLSTLLAGQLSPGTFNYRIVFVDANGNEGLASAATRDIATSGGSVQLGQLPPATTGFSSRRIYRSTSSGAEPYLRIAEINATATTFVDDGSVTRGATLEEFAASLRPRQDAQLSIAPGIMIKLDGARLEVAPGGQLLAEGVDGQEVIFTSLRDVRYGSGGTFDTSSQAESRPAERGDWSGLYAYPASSISVDYALLAHGGGISKIEGSFAGFNAIEVHQADARIAHTRFELNLDGRGGQAANDPSLADRVGRGANDSAVLFVRGAQPIVVSNTFLGNYDPDVANGEPAAISINVNSLNHELVSDPGRATGLVDRVAYTEDNQGPLVRHNELDQNGLNGMVVRGGTLTTEVVLDDTDMVHIVLESIVVPDFHAFGGIRLESGATESLVVKLEGDDTGIRSNGRPLEIDDRIGGMVHVVGQPRHPVVITSLNDCSIGAGFTPDGRSNFDTKNNDQCEVAPTASGTSGSVIVDGGDRDDHGSVLAGPDGNVGTADDLNQDGWLFIEQMLQFAVAGATNNAPNDILAIGVQTDPNNPTFAQEAIESAAIVQGLNITFAVGPAISSEVFTDYKLLYIPSTENNVGGGIVQGDIDLLTARKADVQAHINTGGSLIALTEAESTTPYSWLELPLPFTITDFTAGGISFPLRKTQAAIDAGFTISDADLSFGTPYHNDFTAPTNFNNLVPFVLDTGDNNVAGDIDDRVITLGLASGSFGIGVTPGGPGDWEGITLGQFSHDRNVELAVEREGANGSQSIDSNEQPSSAQFLGALAPNAVSGDDNLRLGFQLQGYLNEPSDVDVYSFDAAAGTEVWFDIDRTRHSLDTVIELIDASGNLLARSDNSLEESSDPSLLVSTGTIPTSNINPLQKSPLDLPDERSVNPRDAGMRVILPGVLGNVSTYHLRVRSGSDDLEQLDAGKSFGAYMLEIRLQERDELAGSTIQHSDIRFAETGIRIEGQTIHSPLAGEIGESSTANDTAAQAQPLGNLLASDRATLSIAGSLTGAADVDFYSLDVCYEAIQDPDCADASFATLLDLDYADGLARANASINVFDAAGNLILTARDSNVAEDRPSPLRGIDMTNLAAGSVGPLDPLLGTVELFEGSYTVAVTTDARTPAEMDQFITAAATNSQLRLEPIPSVGRIVEDHILETTFSTFDAPQVPVLVDPSGITPYHLGDVVLFISQDSGLDSTTVYTVDGFTGAGETVVGSFNRDVSDIDIRDADGRMYVYTTDQEDGTPSDADSGNYLQIDTGDASLIDPCGQPQDDDVVTYHENVPAGNELASDVGIQYDAIAYAQSGLLNQLEHGFAVGHRPKTAATNQFVSAGTDNILFHFDPVCSDTNVAGEATSFPEADRTGAALINGAGTTIRERGILNTNVDTGGTASTTILADEATRVDAAGTTRLILDGTEFSIDHDGNPSTTSPPIVFEFNGGPEVLFDVDPANGIFVRDEDSFTLDGQPYEFNTGPVIVITAVRGDEIGDQDTINITDVNGQLKTFEFDNNDNVGPGNERIVFTNTLSQSQLVANTISAINAVSNYTVQASTLSPTSNRITLVSDSITNGVITSASKVEVEGQPGGTGSSANVIQIEENFDDDQFSDAIVTRFNQAPSITVSPDGSRINFSGAIAGTFTEIINRGVFVDQVTDGLFGVNAIQIPFLASDTATDIAFKMVTALNGQTIPSTQENTIVRLGSPATVELVDPPLRIGGAAPGGDITGMAFVGSDLLAVSDSGGLFRITNPLTANAQLDYLETSAAALQGIDFQGLAVGPIATENGLYRDILFGLDSGGVVYAFDTEGVLQPIFVDGATSIQTGITNAHGIQFSTLEDNLWNFSPARGDDPGHGILPSYDNVRTTITPGDTSLHFGRTDASDIDLPGGAHGTFETRTFSLANYSAADQPVLYFNYFAETEGAGGLTMFDSVRVFAISDTDSWQEFDPTTDTLVTHEPGQWELLVTNNPAELVVGLNDVQEAFDGVDQWRQVRADLTSYAGHQNLRLRFDFSTAGEMNTGHQQTVGDELRMLAGSELRDAETITIGDAGADGRWGQAGVDDDQNLVIDDASERDPINTDDGTELVTFEIDMGYTLVAPTGKAIQDGETFSVDYGAGVNQTFEFDSDQNSTQPQTVPYNSAMTASQLAQAIQVSILAGIQSPVVTGNITGGSEPNDILADAILVNLNGLSGSYRAAGGEIGDNANLINLPKADVDLLEITLAADTRLTVDVDSEDYSNNPDLLNSIVRIFDSAGQQLAINDNGSAPGEQPTADSFLQFTATTPGTYFVGISGFGNTAYDPLAPESGAEGSIGSYDLDITIDTSGGYVQRSNHRVQLPGAVNVVNNSSLTLEGAPGFVGDFGVVLHAGMNADTVASSVRRSLAEAYAAGNVTVIKGTSNLVRVIGHSVVDPGPMALTSRMAADSFGDFNSNQRGQNNAVEGLYIDDIIIGFAERGEMVTGANADTTFVPNPRAAANQILEGTYQLELREAAEYVSVDNETGIVSLTATFDSNDRLANQTTIVAPEGHAIVDGQQFTLSDGVVELVFEFDDDNDNSGVPQGVVEVPFDPADDSATIAGRIRDSINSPAAQSIINIRAANSDGTVSGVAGDNRINLFGNVRTTLVGSRLEVTDVTSDGDLLRDTLIGDGITTIGTATFVGSDVSAGIFRGGQSVIGMESGIILTTGNVNFAEGPNVSDLSTGIASNGGDTDLNTEFPAAAAAGGTLDSTSLEFSIETASGDLFFDFVFASEEYNESVFNPSHDVVGFFVDGVNVALVPGTSSPVSINSVNGGNPLGVGATNPQFFINNDVDDGGQLLSEIGYDGFTSVFQAKAVGLGAGTHTVKLAIADVNDTLLDSAVFISAGSFSDQESATAPDGIAGDLFVLDGDENLEREQGQVLIHSNIITNSKTFGISVSTSTEINQRLQQGPVRNLRELNTDNLIQGVTITNNVLAENAQGGISLSGNPGGGTQVASVPFARIVNNTVVGIGSGIGIEVRDNASPTILNNIIADHTTGIDIDASSGSTVLGGTVYDSNANNSTNASIGDGDFSLVVTPGEELFVNPADRNYYLVAGARPIDSSINSLEERATLTTVKAPLGIGDSPVLAPEYDGTGQLRVDDPSVATPSGLGQNVFKDRGAIDRADFVGPFVVLLNPQDNDSAGLDRNPTLNRVDLRNESVGHFSIQLVDGDLQIDGSLGVGIDDTTVVSSSVSLFQDSNRLIDGVDYRFSYDSTNDIIRLSSLAGSFALDHKYVVELANLDGVVLEPGSGADVFDGDLFSLTDSDGNQVDFEYESGYLVQVPQSLTLIVPEDGGIDIIDGETFVIADDTGNDYTFEMDRNNTVDTGNFAVPYTIAQSTDTIAASIVAALTNADIGLAPSSIGAGEVHLGTGNTQTLDTTATNIDQAGLAGSVDDGDQFTIDDGSDFEIIEFDSDGALTGTAGTVILFNNGQTHEQIAESIVTAIVAADVELTPVHFEDGLIHLAGTELHELDTTLSRLTQTGAPGVRPEFGIRIPSQTGFPFGLIDGQTFTITDGASVVTFELDTNGTGVAANKTISFQPNDDLSTVADAFVSTIQLAGLNLTPSNAGNGIVVLGGGVNHLLDLAETTLTEVGQAGLDASVPVVFIPHESFTETQLASAVAASINGSDLVDVTAVPRQDTVLVTGVPSVSGVTVSGIGAISDRAGNPLQDNVPVPGSADFEIVLSSGLDYGDLPEPKYATLRDSDGPRHLVEEGFSLGALVDVEVDGQPTSDASGDGADDDGVLSGLAGLSVGYSSEIVVNVQGITAERAGRLDAWIDLDHDGDFGDAGEQVLQNAVMVEGDNTFSISIAQSALVGDTFARFRLSSTGNLGPSGPANDGEVEDYAVTIGGNPWLNNFRPLDVNNDGRVTPIDALLVITQLNANGSGPLPVPPTANFAPPPFLDVNGDGFVSPIDALRVIDELNSQVSGEGEAEGEASAADQLTLKSLVSEQLVMIEASSTPSLADFVPRRNRPQLKASQVPVASEQDQRAETQFTISSGIQRDDVASSDQLEDVLDLIGDDLASLQDGDSHDDYFARLRYQ